MVYFIQVENNGPIKIGVAVNPAKRFKTIQGCNHEKLVMIGTIPGAHSLETKIHRDLRKYNIHGEWFKPEKKVLQYIQQLQIADYEFYKGGSFAVIRRDSEESKTDPCPFCGERHIHGIGDGHRTAHCRKGSTEILAADGTVLFQKHGYMLRTRNKQSAV